MEKAEREGIVEGIKIRDHMDSITHLQFADYTIVFLKPNLENIFNLKKILQFF